MLALVEGGGEKKEDTYSGDSGGPDCCAEQTRAGGSPHGLPGYVHECSRQTGRPDGEAAQRDQRVDVSPGRGQRGEDEQRQVDPGEGAANQRQQERRGGAVRLS